MKIDIKEVELKNGMVYHNGDKVDIYNKSLHEIFKPGNKFNRVLCKIEDYNKATTKKHLDCIMMSKVFSNLFKCNIVEDVSYSNEANDAFIPTGFDALLMLFSIEREMIDPYKLDFDSTKLNKESDGSYTFEGEIFIERNNRTSNYFRDVLITSNSSGNTLITHIDCEHIDKLADSYDNVSSHKVVNNDPEMSIYEYIEELGFEDLNNKYLKSLFSDKEIDLSKYLKCNKTESKFSFDNPYLEVVQMYAKEIKKPKLLFDELIDEYHSIEDVRFGLLNLGFNLIN